MCASGHRGACTVRHTTSHHRLVWAGPGRDKATLRRFFDALGEGRSARAPTHRCRHQVQTGEECRVIGWLDGPDRGSRLAGGSPRWP